MNYRALVTGLSILFLRLFLGNAAGASLPTYALTLATNGQGKIALSPAGGVYASNTLVAVTATPAARWVFTGGRATPLVPPIRSPNKCQYFQVTLLQVDHPHWAANRRDSGPSGLELRFVTAPLHPPREWAAQY